jgi:hypothetical protein
MMGDVDQLRPKGAAVVLVGPTPSVISGVALPIGASPVALGPAR